MTPMFFAIGRGSGKSHIPLLAILNADIQRSGLTAKEYFARMNLSPEQKQIYRRFGIKAEILGIEEENNDERSDNDDL